MFWITLQSHAMCFLMFFLSVTMVTWYMAVYILSSISSKHVKRWALVNICKYALMIYDVSEPQLH